MTVPERLTLSAVPDIPLLRPGDDLAAIIIAALERAHLAPRDGDILVVAQKVVSKAQGRYVDLATIIPSERAHELARAADKDPRLVAVRSRVDDNRGAILRQRQRDGAADIAAGAGHDGHASVQFLAGFSHG